MIRNSHSNASGRRGRRGEWEFDTPLNTISRNRASSDVNADVNHSLKDVFTLSLFLYCGRLHLPPLTANYVSHLELELDRAEFKAGRVCISDLNFVLDKDPTQQKVPHITTAS